jgi:hypothetical protein
MDNSDQSVDIYFKTGVNQKSPVLSERLYLRNPVVLCIAIILVFYIVPLLKYIANTNILLRTYLTNDIIKMKAIHFLLYTFLPAKYYSEYHS